MVVRCRRTRKWLASLSVAFLGAIGMAAPVHAQSGFGYDDEDWGLPRARTVVIEKSLVRRPAIEETIEEPVIRRPVVERTVIVKQPIVQPVIHKTVVVERPVIQRVVYRRPVYVRRVVRRPVYFRRTAFIQRGWHERPR
jgi:hypothetical protein